jgi:hypothetical protein
MTLFSSISPIWASIMALYWGLTLYGLDFMGVVPGSVNMCFMVVAHPNSCVDNANTSLIEPKTVNRSFLCLAVSSP